VGKRGIREQRAGDDGHGPPLQGEYGWNGGPEREKTKERPHPGPLPVGEGERCLDQWFDLGWGAYAGLGWEGNR